MQNETLEARRTPKGAIDIRHYASAAAAERRAARSNVMRKAGRGAKRVILAITAFVMFWNVPPMGPGSPREWPYR